MTTTSGAGGGGSIHALCDDVLAEILVRLPSKSVLRCRAVCRWWRRVTTAGSFLAAHSARRPLEMLTLSFSDYRIMPPTTTVSTMPLSADDPTPATERSRPRLSSSRILLAGGGGGDGTALLYSLDGLLVLSQPPGRFVVCNPATRQWTSLPLPVPPPEPRRFAAVACGFYRHGESGEYRLLCHVGYRRQSYYYILAAGAAAPRRLGRAPHPRSSAGYDVLVARRGVLHWLASHPEASTGKILAFDTASETFRLMSPPPPEPAGDTAAAARGLLEVDGELVSVAATAMERGAATASMAIWALEDYEAEAWTLRRRVEVPSPPLPTLSRGGYVVNGALPNCRLILSVGDGEIIIGNCCSLYEARFYPCKNSRTVGAARFYDLKNWRMVGEISFVDENPISLVFRESLVSHAFFNLPRSSSQVAYIKFYD